MLAIFANALRIGERKMEGVYTFDENAEELHWH
jgi:hypothetical protein